MDHPVLKLKKPVEGCLGIKCLVKTWTVHLCVWIKFVMVQKVGLLWRYGHTFELSTLAAVKNVPFSLTDFAKERRPFLIESRTVILKMYSN